MKKKQLPTKIRGKNDVKIYLIKIKKKKKLKDK